MEYNTMETALSLPYNASDRLGVATYDCGVDSPNVFLNDANDIQHDLEHFLAAQEAQRLSDPDGHTINNSAAVASRDFEPVVSPQANGYEEGYNDFSTSDGFATGVSSTVSRSFPKASEAMRRVKPILLPIAHTPTSISTNTSTRRNSILFHLPHIVPLCLH
ncbi:hypothetical protein FA95DRAFT_1559486 [Auriscalpium vulgare]|uniref:Uncharacterized protein n=1 Tax=Auriscalpium vulgare TaxID=40419 RepID=A0ACB8RSG5_9AGAM|nr:hypothetical protein FA95DRAFT_1559486 [Auriscalpium vulgare]